MFEFYNKHAKIFIILVSYNEYFIIVRIRKLIKVNKYNHYKEKKKEISTSRSQTVINEKIIYMHLK